MSQNHVAELKRAIRNLQLDLTAFEEKYNRTSADFYAEFSQSTSTDSEDCLLWVGLYELLTENALVNKIGMVHFSVKKLLYKFRRF